MAENNPILQANIRALFIKGNLEKRETFLDDFKNWFTGKTSLINDRKEKLFQSYALFLESTTDLDQVTGVTGLFAIVYSTLN